MSLKVENIVKRFGEKTAVDNLSFEVNKPGAYGLIGTNGAGKTTTIRIILGIMQSNSGHAEWMGKKICDKNVRFGYMPEERGLYIKNKIFEQLVYFGRLRKMTKHDAEASANFWIGRLGLIEYTHMTAEKLSKGNQQKVQLAAALIHNPDLIFLDEPFSGLDPINTELFKAVIKELTESNKYVIMSSHQMSTVEEFCNDLTILSKGKAILQGNLREIKASYGHTRLVLNTNDDNDAAASAVGLPVSERRADYTEYVINGDEQAELLLKQLIEKGKYPLRYEIREPSLHEIFIEKAGV